MGIRCQKVAAWCLAVVALPLLLGVFAPVQGAETSGKKIFEKRCKKCHELPDPNQPPPEGWAERLDLMAPLARLKGEEKAEVLSYLLAHSRKAEKTVSLAEERRLFEQKCSLCHTPDRAFLEPLNEKSLQHIVRRMRARAPDWISKEDAAAILDYLARAPRTPPNKVSGDAKTLFRSRCSGCHSLERVYLELEENTAPSWVHIVDQMREKAPDWIDEAEANQILNYLRTLKPVSKK